MPLSHSHSLKRLTAFAAAILGVSAAVGAVVGVGAGVDFAVAPAAAFGAEPAPAAAAPASSSTFIEELGLTPKSGAMMREALLAEIEASEQRWIANYEQAKTPEQVAEYQQTRLAALRDALGPMWERTPLNAQITGEGSTPNFRWQNIVFESQPGVYVTGLLTLPSEERAKAPYPALLVVCGHSENGKAYELYQSMGILAAVNGLAAFVVDPVDQGERFQYLNESGDRVLIGTRAHNMLQAGSILVGRNTATFEVWDAMRAIDYLVSRDDIDASKLGVCGTSGGGTQTSYIMNLDERIKLAAPSCYICSFFGDLTHNLGPQDGEQNIWGQLKFGADHADYLFLRAPMPTLMCCCTKDFFNADDGWKSYRYAARIFSRLGYQNRLSIVENDSGHGYAEIARVGTVRWARLWFLGLNDEIGEHSEPLLTEQEVLSIKSGKGVMSLPNARTSFDLNLELADALEPARRAKWENISASDAAALVRARAAIRGDAEIPAAAVVGSREVDGAAERVLAADANVWLTTRENFSAQEQFDELTIVISDAGRGSAATTARFANANGAKVAAVELRGFGDTQGVGTQYYAHQYFGTDGEDNCLAYLLGKTYVGMRAEDLLASARLYRSEHGAKRIRVVAEGYAGSVALAAAVASPGTFASVELVGELPTWRELLGRKFGPIPLTNTIHGVLNDFDIDDLKAFLAKEGVLRE